LTETTTREPNTAFVRLATAAAFASLMSYAVVLFLTPASNNELARFYHASYARLGQLPLVLMGGFLTAVIVAGRLSDRYGKLPAMLTGCLLMAAGLIVFSRAVSFDVIVGAAFLMGLGGGSCEGTAMAIIADLYSDHRRTSMMNMSQSIFGLGAVVAPIGIGWLLKAGMDWRLGYVGAAVVCVISACIALAGMAMRCEKPSHSHEEHGGWREVVSDRLVVWLAFGLLLYVGAELGQSNWLSMYLHRDLHAGSALAATGLSCMWFGIGVGRVLAAWISRHMSELAVIRCSLALAAACQITLLLLHSPVAALAVSFGLGLGLAPVFPTIVSCAGAAHPKQSGTVTAIVIALGPIGGGAFSKAIGVVADHTGMRAALWLCVAALVVNLAIFLKLRLRADN